MPEAAPAATAFDGPLGILAGGGALPEQIAELTMARGRGVHIVGISGEAGPGIERFPHTWVNWGGIGHMVSAFRRAGCSDMIFIGGVKRPDWRKVRPDLGLVRAIPTIIRLFAGGDDHVLRRVVRFFELEGFRVQGVAEVAPELLAGSGALGRVAAAPAYLADGARGLALVEAMGFADVGQAAVICRAKALAIEAAEGTDRMLGRLANDLARRAAGGILVKGPKPSQELRIDMPVIGPRTVENAAAAGLAGIAVRAGRVLVVDREGLIGAADRLGLFVVGIDPPSHPPAPKSVLPMAPVNRLQPDKDLRRDMARAANVLVAARSFSDPAAVVVVRRHVIAIETGEGAVDMFERATSLRQWGATAKSRRRGAVAVDPEAASAPAFDAVIAAAASAGLAGIIIPAGTAGALSSAALRLADDSGLSLVECLHPWRRSSP